MFKPWKRPLAEMQGTDGFADFLKPFDNVFIFPQDNTFGSHLGCHCTLHPNLSTPNDRTKAVANVIMSLGELIPGIRNELYPVSSAFGEPIFFSLERAAAPYFGIKAYGVQMNGYLEKDEQKFLWIGKRSEQKSTYPGMLDQLAAGGLPHDISCGENLIKECEEEAGIPRSISLKAIPVGAVSYTDIEGYRMKRDVLFCYDLKLPDGFIPHNEDFVMYPLCITTRDKTIEDREFDVETGAIMCVEGIESDASAPAVVESNNQYVLYVLEIETIKFITDCQNTDVKFKQLYKDKKTLKAVMEKKHTPADIIEEMKVVYDVDVNYMTAWLAKERAIEMLRGEFADGYRQMPRYMLHSVYPRSHIRMHKAVANEFKYLFITLQPMMHGFKHCRPVVVVDGAHLSGPYQGTFLSASILDGTGCILPIAYGVVDLENDFT
ncbi:Nudix hydrolase 24, chloroplastic [Capsicum annuum]|nr:Nudix hydrolase 24, chloroplastic [Capsicum annuum]